MPEGTERYLEVAHVVEPRPIPSPLATLSNVIFTPHIAGGSRTGIVKEIETIMSNCRAVRAGQPIAHQVKATD